MKAVKKCLAVLVSGALLFSGTNASAESVWYAEFQVLNFSTDAVSHDLDLGASAGLIAGRHVHENFAVEIVAGTGIGDTHFTGAKVGQDSYLGLVLKPNMDIGDRLNVFSDIGYLSVKDYSHEFMYGVGVEIDFTDSVYGSIGALRVSDAGGYQLSVGYRF